MCCEYKVWGVQFGCLCVRVCVCVCARAGECVRVGVCVALMDRLLLGSLSLYLAL